MYLYARQTNEINETHKSEKSLRIGEFKKEFELDLGRYVDFFDSWKWEKAFEIGVWLKRGDRTVSGIRACRGRKGKS